ncbi:nucleolar and spindle-associated protein 1 [Betta splendens]|uniref:Nucleolar and spindle-associated protein 1 n=1 Tax=Betta splendens TaxID=158456 RepID=A0A6P7LIZ2_BETSP|nr:nucleolar and spindle-associated protein 1 [Betta splendens]
MDFLDNKKYAELQSIAKDLGLKANMKADKLLKAIKQYYEEQKNKEDQDAAAVQQNESAAQDHAPKFKSSPCEEDISSTTVFVNTRRGKRNGTKRKISSTGPVTECDPKADGEVAVSDVPGDAKGSKKRKLSSPRGSDKTENEPPNETTVAVESEQQPDIKDGDDVQKDAGKAPKVSKAGKIPRYQKLQQKNKPLLKPVTPNFKKLHEAHFNKMESIDSYVQRKTKQMDAYRSSVKEVKTRSVSQEVDGKAQAKASSVFSPIPVKKPVAEEKRRHTFLSASKAPPNKAAGKEGVAFRPSVLSTRRINVRFSEATHDNEHKKSMVKTPLRMSSCVTSSTPQKLSDTVKANNVKTSMLSATKTPGPFVFTGNTSISTPGTQKKPSFDLQASLARPLNYKPHKGKLKPFSDVKENTAAAGNTTAAGNTSTVPNSHQKNYKQHQVKTREDRRAKQTEQRKQKKASMLGARRGLVMM